MYGVFNVLNVQSGKSSNGSRPGIRAVRKGDWKLIKYDVNDGKVQQTQLFNLKNNPNELLREHHDPLIIKRTGHTPGSHMVNLADIPKYKDKLTEMEILLLEQQNKHNDPYRLWNKAKVMMEMNQNN